MMRRSRNTAPSARTFAGVASILLLVLAARGLFGRNVSGVRAQTGDPARTVFYTRQLADGATGPDIDTRIAIANPGPRRLQSN